MNLKRGDAKSGHDPYSWNAKYGPDPFRWSAKYGPDPYRGRIDASGELVRGK